MRLGLGVRLLIIWRDRLRRSVASRLRIRRTCLSGSVGKHTVKVGQRHDILDNCRW